MASVMGSFECPSGFKEEEVIGQLCLEDLDENSELWLIRMPSDVELSVIDRKKIFLCDTSTPISVQSENGKVLECFAENCEIPNLCVVLPQKSDKKLHEVRKVFQGSIVISEGFNLCDETKVKCEIEKESKVNTVNQSLDSPHHKEKKKKSSKNLDNLNYETEDAENMDTTTKEYSHSKKRSSKKASNTEVKYELLSPQLKERKKKSSTALSVNYESEDAERMNMSCTKKNSKKRSRKRSASEVKNELDLDEFPLCNSQA